MTIGINDGGYFLHSIRYPSKQEEFDSVVELGCTSVEIRLDDGAFEKLPFLNLSKFKWKSLHLLNISKLDDADYEEYLEKLEFIVKEFRFDNVVFHRNFLKNIDDIKEYNCIPWSIENMSKDVLFDIKPKDLEELLQRYPEVKLTLDIQHALTVDPSGVILDEFWGRYSNRISEFHLSDLPYHVPCYVNKNKIIEKFIRGKEVPVILESVYSNYGEHFKEICYVKKVLSSDGKFFVASY